MFRMESISCLFCFLRRILLFFFRCMCFVQNERLNIKNLDPWVKSYFSWSFLHSEKICLHTDMTFAETKSYFVGISLWMSTLKKLQFSNFFGVFYFKVEPSIRMSLVKATTRKQCFHLFSQVGESSEWVEQQQCSHLFSRVYPRMNDRKNYWWSKAWFSVE